MLISGSLIAAACGALCVVGRDATRIDLGDDVLQLTRVPGTTVSIAYPAGWSVMRPAVDRPGLRAYLREQPEMGAMLGLDADAPSEQLAEFAAAIRRDVRLLASETGSWGGDNVVATVVRGEWWLGMADYRDAAETSARATGAHVVMAEEITVGHRPGFRHLEDDGDSLFGHVEVRLGLHRVMSVGVSVGVAARRTADLMLGSVG